MLRYVVLNPPKTKRAKKKPSGKKRGNSMARTKRRRTPARDSKGRFKKKTKVRRTKKRVKRKAVKRKSSRKPARRKTSRKKSSRKKSTAGRRTKASRSAAAKKGWRRRRRARSSGGGRKPSLRRGYRPYMKKGKRVSPRVKSRIVRGKWGHTSRSGRVRKGAVVLNPGSRRGGFVKSLTRNVKSLIRPEVWLQAGQGVLGLSAALAIPAELSARVPALRPYNQGYYGVALSAVSTAVAATAAASLPMKGSARLAQNVMAGGMIASVLKLAALVAPQYMGRLLPGLSVSAGAPMTLPRAAGAAGLGGYYSPSGYPTQMLGALEYSRAARLPQALTSAGGTFSPARGERF